MNILFFYVNPMITKKGGVQRVTRTLSKGLEEEGHHSFYISCKHEENDIENQYYLPDIDSIYTISNIKFIISFLKNKNIDVVVNQAGLGGTYGFLFMFIKLFYPCFKLVTVVHNSPLGKIRSFRHLNCKYYKYSFCSFFLDFFLKSFYFLKYTLNYQISYINSDKLVLLSSSYRDEISFFLPFYSLEKVTSIGNMSYLDKLEGGYPKENIVIYVGRLNLATKRLDDLLRIWSKVENKIPNWKLLIIGSGPDETELKALSQDLNLNNVEFTGFVEPHYYYRKAKIICMTSSVEGLPMVLVEAQSQGVIPIAYNSFKSLGDIVKDRDNGIVVPAFDSESFSEKLIELATNDSLVLRMSKRSLIKSEEFSLKNITKKWIELFNFL
ncbi:glycosyltransferase [Vibrio parahaemolyticus]|nr:glycosyltransferase [Vibrio parahaemolyticus]HAS6628210.1 glycosyltransferase [Vibrio parahaemolyticus]